MSDSPPISPIDHAKSSTSEVAKPPVKTAGETAVKGKDRPEAPAVKPGIGRWLQARWLILWSGKYREDDKGLSLKAGAELIGELAILYAATSEFITKLIESLALPKSGLVIDLIKCGLGLVVTGNILFAHEVKGETIVYQYSRLARLAAYFLVLVLFSVLVTSLGRWVHRAFQDRTYLDQPAANAYIQAKQWTEVGRAKAPSTEVSYSLDLSKVDGWKWRYRHLKVTVMPAAGYRIKNVDWGTDVAAVEHDQEPSQNTIDARSGQTEVIFWNFTTTMKFRIRVVVEKQDPAAPDPAELPLITQIDFYD